MSQFSKRFELMMLNALPVMITTLLAVFFLVSKHVTGLSHFMPLLPLAPVFYWGMAHAREMPYWFVFLLGLVMDSVMGQPLGLSSLLYMFMLFMLHMQRSYIHKEGFVVKWCYFAALLGVTGALQWMILSLAGGRMQDMGGGFFQWLLTVCCYPVMHSAFDWLNEYTHARRWQILHM